MKEISEEEFLKVYNKHLPSRWIKFAYKYFSKETEDKNLVLNKTISYSLLGLFIFGLVGTILELPYLIICITTIACITITFALVLYLFSAVKLNNLRINRICKELNVDVKEYSMLITKFIL